MKSYFDFLPINFVIMMINTDPAAKDKFNEYPEAIKEKLWTLRRIILEAASRIEAIEAVEETLKWGEPSYIVKGGSTIRMDWKAKKPDQYAMYFSCQTTLVETFKAIYGNTFQYEKNRAIVFPLDAVIAEEELSHCVSLALTYHKVKHLPLLGV